MTIGINNPYFPNPFAGYSSYSPQQASVKTEDSESDKAKNLSGENVQKTDGNKEDNTKYASVKNPGQSTEKKPGRKSSPAECDTCKERKYQDGSDENVSFKAAAHIDPASSSARVRSHEQEHVSNAYKKAAQNNGKVISCNVSLHTAVCPECGRTFVSGGTTSTQIRYYNEQNPYQKDMKASDAVNKYRGANIDFAC